MVYLLKGRAGLGKQGRDTGCQPSSLVQGPLKGCEPGAQLTTMYMGKVFWGLKSSSLHSTGNTFCFHISTAISSSTSVGILEECGGERIRMMWVYFSNPAICA
jgi:hypothetical protein